MKMNTWLKQLNRNRRDARKAARRSAEQTHPAHEPFVLESLEDRILLSATPMDVATTTTEPAVSSAIVTTDKMDYSPEETAIITTSNTDGDGLKFADGEMVQFQVTRTDGVPDFPSGNLPWYVQDGVGGFDAYQTDVNGDGQLDWVRADNDGVVNGSISTTWFVEDQYLNSSLLLTAIGQTSGAEATTAFTDSPRVGSVVIGSQSQSITTGVGGSTQYSFDVYRGSNNNNSAGATVTITGLPSGVTIPGLTASVTLSGTGNTTTSAYTGTFTLNAPVGLAAGSYNFTVTVTANQGGGGDNASVTGTLVISTPQTTTTTVSSSLNASTYGQAVSFTANVTGTPSVGTVQFFVDGNAFGSAVNVVNGVAISSSISTLNAGSHSVHAVYSGGTGYAGSTSSTITQTVNKANASFNVTGYAMTYNGSARTATGTATGVNGENLSNLLNLSGTTHTNAGTYTDSWSFAGNTNYNNTSGTVQNVIAKATATVTENNYTGIYDGGTHTASVTIMGVGGVTLASNSITGTNVAESGSVTASISGLQNYNDASGTATLSITKADAVVVVMGYDVTYDGTAHTATYTITGVNGETGATVGTVDVSNTTHTNAGTYASDAWTFTGAANYNNTSGTVQNVIAKATATVTENNYTGIYDGGTHTASVTITGVGGVTLASNSITGTNVAESGSVTASISGLQNYNDASGTATLTITTANATVSIGNATKVFGQTVNLSAVLGTTVNTGVNGETLNISYTSAGVSPAALVGDYAITGSLSNGTGSLSNYNVTLTNGTLTVTTPSVITTVQDGSNVLIVGTNGCDTIAVNASNPSAVTVNGTGSYTVGVGGHVIVYGMACDDNISLTGNVNLEAHGGNGNDAISGGAGHDVLWGDQGNDTLTGAAGNDVLVGGDGSDRLVGSAGHDILVAGDLQGHNYDTLRAISDNWAAKWIADEDMADNNSDNDIVDEGADQLTGSAGHDWFIIGAGDKITDINSATKDGDKITNI